MAFLGTDPGADVTEAWWEEMLVQWFDVPEEAKPAEDSENELSESDSSTMEQSKA
ncbi:MAG: hypothetical protein HC938_02970 [Nitrospira sp.]|nr:hypothetical protein [Nitrospira sp.]